MAILKLLILSLYFLQANCQIEGNLTYPHIVLVGGTGAGKSSIANVLIGASPLCENCTFPVCPAAESCTKTTTYAVGDWLGEGDEFTVVDTPGFKDDENDDSLLIDEMMNVLKNDIEATNALLLVFKGTETRLDASLQQMLREMQALFGDYMWDNVMVAVSFWSYSQADIDKRERECQAGPAYCHDEAWFTSEMNRQLKHNFAIGRNLPFIFIDSNAKHPNNVNDKVQHDVFEKEVSVLWDFVANVDSMENTGALDIMEEPALIIESQEIDDSIERNISDILTRIDVLQEYVRSVQLDVNELAKNVDEVMVNISAVAVDLNQFTEHSSEVYENLDKSILNVTSDLHFLNKSITDTEPPVGSIIAWSFKLNGSETVSLPAGWQRCDGSKIERGIFAGQSTPNLNEDGYFLRGAKDEDLMKFEEDQFQDHEHKDKGHTHSASGHTHDDSGHKHDLDEYQGDGKNNGMFMDTWKNHSSTQVVYSAVSLAEDQYLSRLAKVSGSKSSNIETNYADLENTSSNIGNVEDAYRKGSETVPTNMRVLYIIKIE